MVRAGEENGGLHEGFYHASPLFIFKQSLREQVLIEKLLGLLFHLFKNLVYVLARAASNCFSVSDLLLAVGF